MSYTGIYSIVEAGLKKGSSSEFDSTSKKFTVLKSKSRRPILSTGDLSQADLNVAKIRLVSTIPQKSVDDATTPNAKKIQDKAYVGFILSSVQEQHSEKMQVVSLPGDSYASYFYGSQPRQYSFQGLLLNTAEDQWRDAFEQMYEKYLRGSAASRRFNMVQVSYDNRVVSGWLINMSQQVSSASDTYNSFSFTMLVSRTDIIGGDKELFLKYMTSKQGILTNSNIEADFAVLNDSNYNALVDPVRTGMVVPPPRPKRGGRRSRPTNDCSFTKVTSQGGTSNNSGNTTISSDFRTTAQCTITEALESTKANIEDLERRIAKAGEENNKVNDTEFDALRLEYTNQVAMFNDALDDKKIKAELEEEYVAALKKRKDKDKKSYTIKLGEKGDTKISVTVANSDDGKEIYTVNADKLKPYAAGKNAKVARAINARSARAAAKKAAQTAKNKSKKTETISKKLK